MKLLVTGGAGLALNPYFKINETTLNALSCTDREKR